MRQIQQHQDLVYPRVGHMSGPKASEPWHLWIARVTFSVHRLWTSLVLLNLSRRNLSNNTCGIIIRALMCLKYFFFFVFFLSSSLCNLWREIREKRLKNKKI
jgi:hypothetical protein